MKRLAAALAAWGLVETSLGGGLPGYLKNVEGVVVAGLTARQAFRFLPGNAVDCTKKGTSEYLVYRCKTEGAVATVTEASGRSISFRFHDVRAIYRETTAGPYREFEFDGLFEEGVHGVKLQSSVQLKLWHREATPKFLKGRIKYVDYGTQAGIEAVQEGR